MHRLCIDAVLPVGRLSDDGLWCVIADIVSFSGCNLCMQKANVSSVKYQVCRLIRMLVHICKTLDSMPEEVRCLSSHLICPLRHLSLHLANLKLTPWSPPLSTRTFQLSPSVLTMLMLVLCFYSLLTLQLASCTFHVPALC